MKVCQNRKASLQVLVVLLLACLVHSLYYVFSDRQQLFNYFGWDDVIIINTTTKDQGEQQRKSLSNDTTKSNWWNNSEGRTVSNNIVLVSPRNFTCQVSNGGENNWSVPVFPHLIIAGAAKSGTTALAYFFSTSPKLFAIHPSGGSEIRKCTMIENTIIL